MAIDDGVDRLLALHDAVVRIETRINNGLAGTVAETRRELKEVSGSVQAIRDQITGHIAREDTLIETTRRWLTVAGVTLITFVSALGYLLMLVLEIR